jgi:hypothetical protein
MLGFRGPAGEPAASRSRLEGILVAAVLVGLAAVYLKTLGKPSLWLDEAWEANYYAGITPAPWYNRPILYMAAERALVGLFGPGEFVLRLLPCLAGIACVAVTYRLARVELGRAGAVLAAGWLALSPPFLFAAHEVKHYTLDALFTCLLLLGYRHWTADRTSRRLAIYVALAVVSFGFSFTSIFVVAAIFVVELASGHATRSGIWRFVAANAVVVVLFAAAYAVFYRKGSQGPLLVDYFSTAYLPAAQALRAPLWLARRTRDVLLDLTGIGSGWALGLVLVAGWISAVRRRARGLAWVLPVALLLNAGASALRLYPYGVERLSLYLAPLASLLLGAGIALLWPGRGRSRLSALALAGLLYVLVYPNLVAARPYLTTGWQRENIRGLVATLAAGRRPGDGIYVNEDAEPAFVYYCHRNGLDPDGAEIVWARRHRVRPELHAPEIEELASRFERFWGLYSHAPESEVQALRSLILPRYDCVESWVEGDARLDLYRRKRTAANRPQASRTANPASDIASAHRRGGVRPNRSSTR